MLTGLHSPFVVLFSMFICRKTHKLEKLGVIIVVVGAAVAVLDPYAIRVGEEFNLGKTLFSLIPNVPGALFWMLNDFLKEKFNLMTKIFL
jgi:drug/metabolite transporter (DMT)-like permease